MTSPHSRRAASMGISVHDDKFLILLGGIENERMVLSKERKLILLQDGVCEQRLDDEGSKEKRNREEEEFGSLSTWWSEQQTCGNALLSLSIFGICGAPHSGNAESPSQFIDRSVCCFHHMIENIVWIIYTI
jgi:hypothetical protein